MNYKKIHNRINTKNYVILTNQEKGKEQREIKTIETCENKNKEPQSNT